MKPEKITKIRNKLKLTQEQFAHRLGVTTVTVNRWEQGLAKPSPLAIKAIREL